MYYFDFKSLILPIHFIGSSNVLPSTSAVRAYFWDITSLRRASQSS
uniref:Uncharacterized protein n=1 Tax=Anguilla anguilla TaxID=7936 RepID=A0A0E9RDU8_ANGAN